MRTLFLIVLLAFTFTLSSQVIGRAPVYKIQGNPNVILGLDNQDGYYESTLAYDITGEVWYDYRNDRTPRWQPLMEKVMFYFKDGSTQQVGFKDTVVLNYFQQIKDLEARLDTFSVFDTKLYSSGSTYTADKKIADITLQIPTTDDTLQLSNTLSNLCIRADYQHSNNTWAIYSPDRLLVTNYGVQEYYTIQPYEIVCLTAIGEYYKLESNIAIPEDYTLTYESSLIGLNTSLGTYGANYFSRSNKTSHGSISTGFISWGNNTRTFLTDSWVSHRGLLEADVMTIAPGVTFTTASKRLTQDKKFSIGDKVTFSMYIKMDTTGVPDQYVALYNLRLVNVNGGGVASNTLYATGPKDTLYAKDYLVWKRISYTFTITQDMLGVSDYAQLSFSVSCLNTGLKISWDSWQIEEVEVASYYKATLDNATHYIPDNSPSVFLPSLSDGKLDMSKVINPPVDGSDFLEASIAYAYSSKKANQIVLPPYLVLTREVKIPEEFSIIGAGNYSTVVVELADTTQPAFTFENIASFAYTKGQSIRNISFVVKSNVNAVIDMNNGLNVKVENCKFSAIGYNVKHAIIVGRNNASDASILSYINNVNISDGFQVGVYYTKCGNLHFISNSVISRVGTAIKIERIGSLDVFNLDSESCDNYNLDMSETTLLANRVSFTNSYFESMDILVANTDLLEFEKCFISYSGVNLVIPSSINNFIFKSNEVNSWPGITRLGSTFLTIVNNSFDNSSEITALQQFRNKENVYIKNNTSETSYSPFSYEQRTNVSEFIGGYGKFKNLIVEDTVYTSGLYFKDVIQNLTPRSDSINAGATGSFVVVESNYELAPDGSLTADLVRCIASTPGAINLSGAALPLITPILEGENGVLSFWAKNYSDTQVTLFWKTSGNVLYQVRVPANSDWTQYVYVIRNRVAPSFTSYTFEYNESVGDSISLWGLQINKGTIPLKYVKTTTTGINTTQDTRVFNDMRFLGEAYFEDKTFLLSVPTFPSTGAATGLGIGELFKVTNGDGTSTIHIKD